MYSPVVIPLPFYENASTVHYIKMIFAVWRLSFWSSDQMRAYVWESCA